MASELTPDEFGRLLAGFGQSAFRLEARDHYAVTEEREAFEAFLAGRVLPPARFAWWREWLDMIREATAAGKTVSRVRLLSDPPSAYQQWEIAGDHWHAEAGEQIRYLGASRALRLGAVLRSDWWLLDDERLILMRFGTGNKLAKSELVTDPGAVARYREWRDLAVSNATPAEEYAAA